EPERKHDCGQLWLVWLPGISHPWTSGLARRGRGVGPGHTNRERRSNRPANQRHGFRDWTALRGVGNRGLGGSLTIRAMRRILAGAARVLSENTRASILDWRRAWQGLSSGICPGIILKTATAVSFVRAWCRKARL